MIWLRTLGFTVLAPGTVAVLLPWLVLRLGVRPDAPGPWRWAGVPLLAAGAATYLWCARDFVVRGRGTPAPWDAPKALVAEGLYARVRNPMYVGIVAIVLGEAAWFGAPLLAAYAALVWVVFHLRVLLYEEPVLDRDFGDAWRRYRDAVPRWLPRLTAAPRAREPGRRSP